MSGEHTEQTLVAHAKTVFNLRYLLSPVVLRCFQRNGGMREIRRPKPEIRKKPEIRNPSRPTLRSSTRADSDLGRRDTEDGAAFERRARVSATSRSCDF